MESPEQAPPLRRAKITYGGRGAGNEEHPHATSSGLDDDAQIGSWCKPATQVSESNDDYTFDWKRRLEEMDRIEDITMEEEEQDAVKAPGNEFDPNSATDPRTESSLSSIHSEENDSTFDTSPEIALGSSSAITPPTSPPTVPPKPQLESPPASPHPSSMIISEATDNTSPKSKSKASRKLKPLTKKQKEETRRESARLLADKPVAVNRAERKVLKVQDLFTKISTHARATQPKPSFKQHNHQVTSDPIVSEDSKSSGLGESPIRELISSPTSDSPAAACLSPSARERLSPCSTFQPLHSRHGEPTRDLDSDNSEDDLRQGSNIVAKDRERRQREQQAKNLSQLKRQVLETQFSYAISSDEELEISSTSPKILDPRSKRKQATSLHTLPKRITRKPAGKPKQSNQQRQLLLKSRVQATEVIKQRQADWSAQGGVIKEPRQVQPGEQMVAQLTNQVEAMNTDEGDAAEDDDYVDDSDDDRDGGGDQEASAAAAQEYDDTRRDRSQTPEERIEHGADKENIAPSPCAASQGNDSDIQADGFFNSESAWPTPAQRKPTAMLTQNGSDSDSDEESFLLPAPLRRVKHVAPDSGDEEDVSKPTNHGHALGTILVADTSFACPLPAVESPYLLGPGPGPNGPRVDQVLDPQQEFDDLDFSQIFASDKPVDTMENPFASKPSSLMLTQQEGQLPPLIGMSTQQVRDEEEIFLEDAEQKRREHDAPSSLSGQSRYTNAQGLLTQTKPPELMPMPETPTQRAGGYSTYTGSPLRQSTIHGHVRRPLETISLSALGTSDGENEQGLRRLRKISTPSETIRVRNAFEELLSHNKSVPKEDTEPRKKIRSEHSEFIADEADESDEERMLGFGGYREHDEEHGSGEEDQDAVVDGLLDDQVMDVDSENLDKVLEKHKEHEAADDLKLQKHVEDVIEGRERGKRRDRGIGLSDSDETDDDDDDDDGARRRRSMQSKKRKVNVESLDALAANPETQPFHREYLRGIDEDDAPEFGYLKSEEKSTSAGGDEGLADIKSADSGEASDSETEERTLHHPLQSQIGPRSQPSGLSFDSDNDLLVSDGRYREVATKNNQPGAGSTKVTRRGLDETHRRKRGVWAKEENLSLNSGSGRAIAVTGHLAQPKVLRRPQITKGRSESAVPPLPAAAPSALGKRSWSLKSKMSGFD